MAKLLDRPETLCDRQTGSRCKLSKKCWRYQNPNRDGWEGDYFSEYGRLNCDGFTPLPQATKDPEKVQEEDKEFRAEVCERSKD